MAAKSAAVVSSGSGPPATETEAAGGDMRRRRVSSGGRRRRRAAGRGDRGRVRRSALDRTAEGDPRRGVVGVGAEAVACIAATALGTKGIHRREGLVSLPEFGSTERLSQGKFRGESGRIKIIGITWSFNISC
jgi:hypothetical protein